MKPRLDRALSVVLTVATCVLVAAVVKREFLAPAPTRSQEETRIRYYDNWPELASQGIRVGQAASRVTILEFFDLECPACRIYRSAVMKDLRSDFGDTISFLYVHFPLRIHRLARAAAVAAECADRQSAFEAFMDLVFAKQESLAVKSWSSYAGESGVADVKAYDACVRMPPPMPRIDAGLSLGDRLQLRGTPSLMINGWLFPSPPTATEARRVIHAILAGKRPFKRAEVVRLSN